MNRTRLFLPLGVVSLTLAAAFIVPRDSPAIGEYFPEADHERTVPAGWFGKRDSGRPPWWFFKRRKQQPPRRVSPERKSFTPESRARSGAVEEKAVERFPIDLAVATSTGETTSLGEVMERSDSRAVLIDFWASWCGPCLESMPALKARSADLARFGVAVAGINVEGDPRVAERVRRHEAIDFPWLIEPATEPFTRQFRIDTIPRVILVDRRGEVLFNGHPDDFALERHLETFRRDRAGKKSGAETVAQQ